MEGRFHFLGTGGSMGVPVIGCTCPVCLSDNPKNVRLRSSGLVEVKGKKILIDCGPDFRCQALKAQISHIDCCLITHIHHDHTAGLDELRALTMHRKEALPCITSKEAARDLKKRFDYIFHPDDAYRLLSKIQLVELEGERGVYDFQGISIKYLTFSQIDISVLGFRFGNFAYLSDIKSYPESIFEDLVGVETMVLSALRYTPSPLHFSVDEAVDFARKSGAKMTYLTHISHDLDYEKTNAYLPRDVQLSYDGLSFDFKLGL
jgi:phosphoribosyl 1,2-cyclic phosphate phosphodiesterase